MQCRRVLPVEDREMDAIEAHQSAAGTDPQVSIPRLGEGLHRLFRQPIGSLPDMPRVARKSVALRHRAGARKHHHPDRGRGPGGNRTYSMHGGAQYTAKQPSLWPMRSAALSPNGWESVKPGPPTSEPGNSPPDPTFGGSKERPGGIQWSFSKAMLQLTLEKALARSLLQCLPILRFIPKGSRSAGFKSF